MTTATMPTIARSPRQRFTRWGRLARQSRDKSRPFVREQAAFVSTDGGIRRQISRECSCLVQSAIGTAISGLLSDTDPEVHAMLDALDRDSPAGDEFRVFLGRLCVHFHVVAAGLVFYVA